MNFELKDIVDTAGATVGLVIATSIFMQLLTTKAIALFDRYRELTMEYRSTQEKPQRNENLRAQIGLYRRRCHLIQMALASLAYAEFIFLATILLSSASLIFKQATWLKIAGSLCMLAGLLAIGLGVLFELKENFRGRDAIESETADLSEFSGQSR